MPLSLRFLCTVLVVAGWAGYWFYLRWLSSGAPTLDDCVSASFAALVLVAGLLVLWLHKDPREEVWEKLGAVRSRRRRLLESSESVQLEAATGRSDYTEAERWLAKVLLRRGEEERRGEALVRATESVAKVVPGGGLLGAPIVVLAHLSGGSSQGWNYMKSCWRRGSSLEGEPVHLLEDEAGLVPELVESFYQAARDGHARASHRKTLLDDDRFDVLYGNPGRGLMSTCRGDYRGLQGAPNWCFDFLARDIGTHLGHSELKKVFELIDEQGIPAGFDYPPLGALKWMKEIMEKEGYEPSVFAVNWRGGFDLMRTLGFRFVPTKPRGPFVDSGEPFLGLPLVREEPIAPGRIYCIDFKAFCSIRYQTDTSLGFTWYKRVGSEGGEIVFAAYNPCDIQVKDPAAARYIEPLPAD